MTCRPLTLRPFQACAAAALAMAMLTWIGVATHAATIDLTSNRQPTFAPTTTQANAITLDLVSSPALTPGDTWSVSGHITNTSTTTWRDILLRVGLDWQIRTEHTLQEWLSGTTNPTVDTWTEVSIPEQLLPGQSTAITLKAPVNALGLPTSASAFGPRGVLVQAHTANGDILGNLRTCVVWQPTPVPPTTTVGALVPLTTTHTMVAHDLGFTEAINQAWQADLPRLQRVVQASKDLPGVAWAIDGAAFTPATGTANANLRAWQQTLRETTRQPGSGDNKTIFALPWGDVAPDLTSKAGDVGVRDAAMDRTTNQLTSELGESGTPLFWPAEATRTGIRTAQTNLTANEGFSTDLAASDAAATQGTLRTAARLAALASASPGQSTLAALPRSWNPNPQLLPKTWQSLQSLPWVHFAEPFPGMGNSPPSSSPDRAAANTATSTTVRPPSRALPSEHIQAVSQSLAQVNAFQPALVDPAALQGYTDYAYLLAGQAWQGANAEQLRQARKPLTDAINMLYQGVQVVPGSTVNFLSRRGSVPVTVTNTLPYGLRLWLTLHPSSGQLVAAKGATPVELAPASADRPAFSTKAIGVSALANGDVRVVAVLSTPVLGGAVISRDEAMQVNIRREWENRPLIAAGMLLLVLFLAGLARSMLRGGARRLPPESAPDPDDVDRAAEPSNVPDGGHHRCGEGARRDSPS